MFALHGLYVETNRMRILGLKTFVSGNWNSWTDRRTYQRERWPIEKFHPFPKTLHTYKSISFIDTKIIISLIVITTFISIFKDKILNFMLITPHRQMFSLLAYWYPPHQRTLLKMLKEAKLDSWYKIVSITYYVYKIYGRIRARLCI